MRTYRRFAVLTLGFVWPVLLTACGGGNDSLPPTTQPLPVPASVSTVTLNQTAFTLTMPGSLQLTATTRDAAGATLNGRVMSWSSNATTVATVSADGLVTAVAAGTASVTATSEGRSAAAAVTVTAVVGNVAVSAPANVEIGVAATATAAVTASGGAIVAAPIVWSSSNVGVLTVSATGVLAGVTAGSATLTATTAGISGTRTVGVVPRNINSLVDSVRIARGLPALVGAIVTRTGGVVAVGVGGTRRATGGALVTLDDRWHIGSNLKAITATLAAIAVRQGRIGWTTTVASMFPELGAAVRAEYRDVTLAELLAMSGGIRNDPPGSAYSGATARAQRESAAAWGLAAAPIGPRGGYHYSNIGYVIAGAMIERAMNGTYEALLVSELGAPVGATQIGFGPTTTAGSSAQPVGHSRSGGQWVACEACDNPPGLSAAGRSHMSINDWGRIIHELLKADAGTSTLLTQADARRTFTGVTPVPGGEPYALGWISTTRPWGGRTVTHSGTNVTNHSVAWVGLDNGVAFIAATNAADLTAGGTGVALDGIVGRMLTLHQTGR